MNNNRLPQSQGLRADIFKQISLQWVFALLILFTELCLLYFFKDGVTDISSQTPFRNYLNEYGPAQFWLATHIHIAFKSLFCSLLIVLILMVATEIRKPYFLDDIYQFRIEIKSTVTNIISFSLLIWILTNIGNPEVLIVAPHSIRSLFYTFSPVIWLVYIWSDISFLFPFTSPKMTLWRWVKKNLFLTFLIFIVTTFTIIPELNENILSLWSDLLLRPTLAIAFTFTHWFGLDTHIFEDGKNAPIFGTDHFEVGIWPQCSGYEGMILIFALLGAYCYYQRKILSINRALLIIPLAGLTMFFFNGIRLAILIAIGHFYSPELALTGFHVVGGWLNLLVVFVVSLFILNFFSYFSKNPQLEKSSRNDDLPFLLPLLVLMMVGLFDQVFVTKFDWMYPIPICFSALIIFYYRSYFLLIIEKTSFISYVIGVSVFFLWIFLIPEDPIKNQLFFNEVATAPLGLALLWLAFRVIGAVLIVPIAEELAFRGLALPRLEIWINNLLKESNVFKFSSHCIAFVSTAISLIFTSIIFGVLHSDFLAGSLAGIGFGLVYLSRRKLIDAIVSHAVTNGLLAIYVIAFGYWSYW